MDKTIALHVTLNWVAVFLYVVATIANVYGVLFKNERAEKISYWPTAAGMAVHSFSILLWWRVVGHGPYMAPSEVLSSDAWMALCIFLVFLRIYPKIKPVSVVALPAAFLMLALATVYDPGIRSLPPTFGSVWLVFHIGFYKISLGTLIIALAFSLFYLRKSRLVPSAFMSRLPPLEMLDLYAYRFAGFGFVFWGIAMLAGSIWAYKSWGRYWGWDPVETWSLITWLIFGAYLHLRRFFLWSGGKAAWLFICCFVMSLVSLFLTSHMGSSIHAEYFQ